MRSHSDEVRSDVYRIPMLIGESESLYNCKMHDLSSFSRRSYFLNRLSDIQANVIDQMPETVLARTTKVRELITKAVEESNRNSSGRVHLLNRTDYLRILAICVV